MYNVRSGKYGVDSVVVSSINSNWEKKFGNDFSNFSFSEDGRKILYLKNRNSLHILKLGSSHVVDVSNVTFFSLINILGVEWLCYRILDKPLTLFLKNTESGKVLSFNDVERWVFSEDGSQLVLWESNQVRGNHNLTWVNMVDNKIYRIWEGKSPENLTFDKKHQQLVFKAGDSLWLYKSGASKVNIIPVKDWIIETDRLNFQRIDRFSSDGNRLFVYVKKKQEQQSVKSIAEVWSYQDHYLPSVVNPSQIESTLAIIDLESYSLTRLQVREEEKVIFPQSKNATDTLALVRNDSNTSEPWSIGCSITYSLISTKNGERRRLNFLDQNKFVQVSPQGKFLIYFDSTENCYKSYEIKTGAIKNITKGLNVSWIDINRDDSLKKGFPRGIGNLSWFRSDEYVLIYDRFDIWKLDPLGKEKPINITNGYGKKNQVVFSYTICTNTKKILSKNNQLYLTAFNVDNKNNGFFLTRETGDPEYLDMQPFLYQTNSAYVPDDSDFLPIKAKNSDVYVLRRMSATDAPNYFSTRDFKSFTRLSDLQPQKKYNWYTTDLYSWKSLDGRKLQGILYKPENFDPNRRYPVIFYYYERKSDGLNAFLMPGALGEGNGTINIPTYVSNGYLVFCPDIFYTIGDPMQGTYDAIVSAAKFISGLPFVNSKKLGIQGASHGGIQTNYLITHSDLFSAACSSSGASDIISKYGSLAHGGDYYESGQGRMGQSLWEIPDSYIRNSPIFGLAQVSTPLLIMHTRKDDAVDFSQAIELFTGLRRLGKKAWMLVYDKGNHGLFDKEEVHDFSTRMMQFFDHYLKNRPAPVWMLDGKQIRDRKWELGLESDNSARTPGSGILNGVEQAKVDSLMTSKTISNNLKIKN